MQKLEDSVASEECCCEIIFYKRFKNSEFKEVGIFSAILIQRECILVSLVPS